LPWIHLAVFPEGSTQLCCVASRCVQDNGAVLNLQTHSLETIWNSLYMRKARRDMLEGRHVPDCSHCYVQEKQGGVSLRQEANARWADELGPLLDALVEESRHRDHEASELPLYYQLMPGNLCNLKCRMCNPLFSTMIERDPVHSQWIPSVIEDKPVLPTDWTKGCVRLGPEDVLGVDCDGFHLPETHDGQPFRWTNGNATLTISLPPGVRAESLNLSLRGGFWGRHRLRVLVNGTLVHDDLVSILRRRRHYTFAVPRQVDQSVLKVQLQSNASRHGTDPRELGVAIERIELMHTLPEISPLGQVSRLPVGPWYRDDGWIRDVLLQNADHLRALYFTGGEPLIEKQVENILQYLLDRRIAGNVILEVNSNCTIVRDAMVQKLLEFKKVYLGMSIDAYGDWYEYIRYPAKWAIVRRNVERLAALFGDRFVPHGSIVLQVYNLLNVVEILAFFDKLDIPFNVELATSPSFLNIGVLPRRVREVAARRLQDYADQRCRPHQRPHVLTVINQIEKVRNRYTPEGLRDLMLFTNDLDATRNQSVRQVHGELLDLLHKEGFTWTDERSALVAA
jgi:glutamate-1-semialdehyde 2,1-aminomutase